MNFDRQKWTALGSTTLFVLLWSSGAIFSRLGLQHASPFAFLTLRFVLAFAVLLGLGMCRQRWLPERGTRLRVALTGLLLLGNYASCYLLALDHGMAPGILATVLGVQPILTLMLMERGFTGRRLMGLGLAFAGLMLVVSNHWTSTGVSRLGLFYALGALGSMTAGAIMQKRLNQPPLDMLPLQYACSLLLCAAVALFQPMEVRFTSGLLLALIWLGLVISVVAQLLLYRLIQAGNLVNVTSLFYLVPATTALLDLVFLGNRMSFRALAGMAAILAALLLVFRQGKVESREKRRQEGLPQEEA